MAGKIAGSDVGCCGLLNLDVLLARARFELEPLCRRERSGSLQAKSRTQRDSLFDFKCFSLWRGGGGAGQLLSTAALRELTKQLGTSSQAEYLPENVIARTPELIVWWAPASVRPIFFRHGSELANISGKLFPHPALLFAVRNGVLFVRALPESKRPGADTKLAAAPYWNIDNDGRVCQGTMRVPRSLSVVPFPLGNRRSFKANLPIPEGQAA